MKSIYESKESDLSLSYLDEGEGDRVVLLLHGFASTASVNWQSTSWLDTLTTAGYRCIAPDHRGHGESTKFYNPTDYGPDIFASDAIKLLDHLGIDKCAVLGFSMGSRISAWLAHKYSDRIACAIFGGMGICMIAPHRDYAPIAHAFETDDITTITDSGGIAFRTFADKTGSDRHALAACIRPSVHRITKELLGEIKLPVLVAVGDKDEVGGSPSELAALIPNAESVVLEGLDHMRSSGAESFKRATLSFLSEHYNVS